MTTPPTPYAPQPIPPAAVPAPPPAAAYPQAVPYDSVTEQPAAPTAAEALEAEVAAEEHPEVVPDGYVRVPLGADVTVRALMPSKWRASHLRCLNRGDLDAMATGTDDDPSGEFRPGVLHEEDVAVWFDVDPTQDEIAAWFDALSQAGEALGKSSGRSRSMNRTRRR